MKYLFVLVLSATLMACQTPNSKFLAYSKAIKTADETTADALDLGLISAQVGKYILTARDIAENDLRKAVKAYREGEEREVWERILDGVMEAINHIDDLLSGKTTGPLGGDS